MKKFQIKFISINFCKNYPNKNIKSFKHKITQINKSSIQ